MRHKSFDIENGTYGKFSRGTNVQYKFGVFSENDLMSIHSKRADAEKFLYRYENSKIVDCVIVKTLQSVNISFSCTNINDIDISELISIL